MTKNIIYFGSPAFSAQILETILKFKIENLKLHVAGVVTSPDRPTGRHQKLTPSPVALVASRYDLPVFKPEKLDEANLSHLKLLKPDYFLVVSYGKIIPDSYLAAAKTLNIHFSLLPKYRGALCIQEAIKNGDFETGVTLMEMESKLDTGPIIAQEKVKIGIDDNVATLTTKLTQSAISLIKHFVIPAQAGIYSKKMDPRIREDDSLISTPQDSSLATYTPSHKTLSRQSAFISWATLKSAMRTAKGEVLHNLIRSLNPEPGAWTIINGKEVKILKTSLSPDTKYLILDTIQLPGKSPTTWQQFLAGNKVDAL